MEAVVEECRPRRRLPVARAPTITPRVSVVIPALNEARNLPHVLTRLPFDVYEVVLVDGHSVDLTMEVARALYCDVRFVRQDGYGKGNALACGFAACRGDIIVMLDADGSADPGEIPRFVDALCRGADFAKGSRFLPGGGSSDITRLRRLGNWGLNSLVNLLYGTRYTDLCYGYNAFWVHCLPRINVDCDGFEVETLINVRIAKAGLRVSEVPSYEGLRIHGVSNLNAVRDGWRVLMTIVRERFRQVPANPPRPYLGYAGLGSWNGIERRSDVDRRARAERRSGSRNGIDRRGTLGRRAADRGVDTFIPPEAPPPGA
ncbi:MAG TPA: glycosyltransferase family 2 protein [Chloroflexota bacterium]|nr:glycosyltransferase family 2 protein [Chloroflexota bacterium]